MIVATITKLQVAKLSRERILLLKLPRLLEFEFKKEDVHFRVIDSLDTNRRDLDRVRSTKRYR
ncbi:hypothetical protein NC651_022308 [Populus alba x Populus x berolinensis]|nr:hypothetical protein NC651_022308 [Populus alba x Populus x berolinensis]